MNLKTAARRLGVHYLTAYRWVRNGELPAVKIGAIYEISEAGLAAFEARRAAGGLTNDRTERPAQAPEPPDLQAILLDTAQHTLERTGTNPRALFEVITVGLTRTLADLVIIRLLSEDGRWLEAVAYHHRDPARFAVAADYVERVRQPADTGLLAEVFATAPPAQAFEVPEDRLADLAPPEYRQYVARGTVGVITLVPVAAGGERLGVLILCRDRPARAFTEDERAFAVTMADLLAAGVRRARLTARSWQAREGLVQRVTEALAASTELTDDEALEVIVGLVAETDDAAAAADEHGVIFAVSPQFAELFRADPSELVGRPWLDTVIPPESRSTAVHDFDPLLRGEIDYADAELPRMVAGTPVLMRIHAWAARRPDGRAIAILTTYARLSDAR